ncbi:hypothetical protein BU24DRAFT_10138 [Aaosphaeria arxii CBS 175.79]|uniref:Zn(2)-C6 fungal-type domain-containing protein n=1 Tax=Aaosphaeria arxii CBS 175.79 TaxID=1450172 RepID=A0A6A5Y5N5_9PLEO|nr:uncharacterized protein BU24DRAFT_10138 [Aaosphaeria arxii CBS 175.79]KAF2020872.1 hypothetical protein BU24DRAFT_10138 [Aaosphaeria arxii CBS 175.79]
MASGASYTEADAQMGGGPGLYGNQNGGGSPSQQQQHLSHDHDLSSLSEGIAHIQRNNEMMDAGGPQAHHMGASMNPAHHQFQTPPRPAPSPQQMAQTVMGLDEHNMFSDHDSSRKRSKVSRACDECRRKKIRCDATNENGPEACSSCKRTGARCQFSRQPMKRGPSKGYIKELADRLNSLENQIQYPHAQPTQTFDYAPMRDQPVPDTQAQTQFQRKRTHSISEGLQEGYNRSSWPAQDRGIEAWDPRALSLLTSQDLPSNGQTNRRGSYGDLTLAGNLINGTNEGTIKSYYSTIHLVYPVLAQDSTALNRLTNCPAKLRESFFLALECSVHSYAPTALPPMDVSLTQLIQKCLEALELAQHTLSDPDSSRQFYNHLVYCQTLVFLIIASDRPSTDIIASTSELLGRLAGRISELGINDAKIVAALRDQDRELYEDSRRLFWTAFILDRFNASNKGRDMVLPLYAGSVSRDDYDALGEVGYHLARAADIIGQVTYIARAGNVPSIDPTSAMTFADLTSSSPASLYLNGQLLRFRESLEISSLPPTSPPYLAYQYLRIVVARASTYTAPKETLAFTKELLGSIQAVNGSITPLHHIFAHIVATSLTDLADKVETQIDAHGSIREMDEAIANGNILVRIPDGLGWDTAIRNILHQKRSSEAPPNNVEQTGPATEPNMAGLQHLAAAAVGEREGTDARPSSSGGSAQISQSNADVKHDLTAAMAAASEAAAAQATAAAAQQQLQSASPTANPAHDGNANSNSGPGGDNDQYDPSLIGKDGFMSAVS